MLAHTQKRILIDSSLQHAANTMELPSTVVWVATQPEVFGYGVHNNFNTKVPYKNGTVDSYLYDYDFTGTIHQCPYKSVDYELHDVDAIVQSVLT